MRRVLRFSRRTVTCTMLTVASSACALIHTADLPNGDHVVTTYVRLQGLDEARDDNLWQAHQICPDGVLLLDRRTGEDDNGVYLRWVYGCVAPGETSRSLSTAVPR